MVALMVGAKDSIMGWGCQLSLLVFQKGLSGLLACLGLDLAFSLRGRTTAPVAWGWCILVFCVDPRLDVVGVAVSRTASEKASWGCIRVVRTPEGVSVNHRPVGVILVDWMGCIGSSAQGSRQGSGSCSWSFVCLYFSC